MARRLKAQDAEQVQYVKKASGLPSRICDAVPRSQSAWPCLAQGWTVAAEQPWRFRSRRWRTARACVAALRALCGYSCVPMLRQECRLCETVFEVSAAPMFDVACETAVWEIPTGSEGEGTCRASIVCQIASTLSLSLSLPLSNGTRQERTVVPSTCNLTSDPLSFVPTPQQCPRIMIPSIRMISRLRPVPRYNASNSPRCSYGSARNLLVLGRCRLVT